MTTSGSRVADVPSIRLDQSRLICLEEAESCQPYSSICSPLSLDSEAIAHIVSMADRQNRDTQRDVNRRGTTSSGSASSVGAAVSSRRSPPRLTGSHIDDPRQPGDNPGSTESNQLEEEPSLPGWQNHEETMFHLSIPNEDAASCDHSETPTLPPLLPDDSQADLLHSFMNDDELDSSSSSEDDSLLPAKDTLDWLAECDVGLVELEKPTPNADLLEFPWSEAL